MTMCIDGPEPGPSSPPFQNNSLKQYQFQFYPGCSPGTLMGPLDIPDLHNQMQSSSMTSSSISGSLLLHRKLGNIAASNPICKDYTCCGLTLHDLHALVEHFEECHVVVVDDDDQPTPTQVQPQQQPQSTSPQATVPPSSTSSKPQPTPITTSTSSTSGTATTQTVEEQDEGEIDIDTLDDMDISDSEEDSPSPPSPVHSSGYSTPSLSPPLTPVMAFDTITTTRHPRFLGHGGSGPGIVGGLGIDINLAAGAFNSYGGLVAGKQQPPSPPSSQPHQSQPQRKLSCLPPSLLTTPTTSRAPSPFAGSSSAASTPLATPTSATPTLPFPLHNLPTPAKPFPCPNPSCSKTYKQSNGLKYHLTHGSCSIAPSASGRVEKEEKRFACAIPICERRYKNLNGLRYHYAHTGHGGPEYMMSAAEKEKAKAASANANASTTTTTMAGGQGEIRKIRLVPHHVLQQQQQKLQQHQQRLQKHEQEDVIMA